MNSDHVYNVNSDHVYDVNNHSSILTYMIKRASAELSEKFLHTKVPGIGRLRISDYLPTICQLSTGFLPVNQNGVLTFILYLPKWSINNNSTKDKYFRPQNLNRIT